MCALSAAIGLVRGTEREIGMRRGDRQRTEEESKLLDLTTFSHVTHKPNFMVINFMAIARIFLLCFAGHRYGGM